jgi:hypothetical protein
MSNPVFADHEAAQAVLSILDYLSDLFTGANKEYFTRLDVLNILNLVRSDPDLLDPDMVIAFQVATEAIDQGEEEAAS